MEESVGVQDAMAMLRSVTGRLPARADFCIDKDGVYRDSLTHLSKDAEMLHGGVKVAFCLKDKRGNSIMEPGVGDGVILEWFLLVAKFFTADPRYQHSEADQSTILPSCGIHDLAMFFEKTDEDCRYGPNGVHTLNAQDLTNYRCFGKFLALTLMHQVKVPIKLDRTFFKLLSGDTISLEDLEDTDHELHKQWTNILKGNEDYLTALAEQDLRVQNPETKRWVKLKPNGKNKKKYVRLVIQEWASKRSEQVRWVSKGFGEMIRTGKSTEQFFKSLTLEEFNFMLHGPSGPLNIADMKQHTSYQNCDEESEIIKWLWEVVEKLPDDKCRGFLQFWTSLYNVSSNGFADLDPGLAVNLLKDFDAGPLVRAMTCFRQLLVPPYESKEELETKLLEAIEYITGFGMD